MNNIIGNIVCDPVEGTEIEIYASELCLVALKNWLAYTSTFYKLVPKLFLTN